MKLTELFELRERFWKLNKGSLVTYRKLMEDPGDGSSLKGQPDKLIQDTEEFLNLLLGSAKDAELRSDIELRLDLISKHRGTPFANIR